MATAAAVAASYSPLTGLNLGRDTQGAGAGLGGSYDPAPPVLSLGRDIPGAGNGLGGAYGAPSPANSTPTTFPNPNAAPSNPTPIAPKNPFPGSITGAGAFTPDWEALIKGDAGFKDAAAALAASDTNNREAFNAQLANAYESFGKNIDLSALASQLGMSQADIQNALNSGVRQLAQENTDAGTSTTARLDQANQIAQSKLIADLNRRGILHSGETGYQLDQQNTGYRQAQSDAYQKFLGYLQQYQQGYLTAQQKNSSDLASAYSSAADRAYNNNHSTPGVTAQFDHVDSAGKPVYKDTSGNFFNADGSAYTAPAPPAAVPHLPPHPVGIVSRGPGTADINPGGLPIDLRPYGQPDNLRLPTTGLGIAA